MILTRILDILIGGLLARYINIHYLGDYDWEGYLFEGVALETVRSWSRSFGEGRQHSRDIWWERPLGVLKRSTASLTLREGQEDYGKCSGDDFYFRGLLNQRPIYENIRLQRVIAFNGLEWVCTDMKYLQDIEEGALKDSVFGGYGKSDPADVPFSDSSWKRYLPGQSIHKEEPSVARRYGGLRLAIEERGLQNGGCAAEDYVFAGEVNGSPLWHSVSARRIVAFNTENWVCTGEEYLRDILNGPLKDVPFGGYQASTSGVTSLHTSQWQGLTVRLFWPRDDP